MAELNLPNIREGGNIRFRIGLEDGGVAVDWSGLEDIRVFLYADAQKQVSGECTIEVDAEDNTVLACLYSGDDVQFRGINSVLVRAKYMGDIKVYDKPAINIVARTSEATGVVEIDDPVVPVQISVEDVSTSLLNNAIDAAINAAAEAEKAAHLVPLQVLEDCVEATGKALEAASKAPYIDETTGNWFVWDAEAGEYVDSGKTARGATGNGIASWSVVESAEDAGNNVVTVTFTDGTSESFNVKNGHTGNGIASIVQTVESPDDAGTNVITITMTNGTVVTFNVKNGSKGTPGVAQAAYKSVSSLPTASAQTMDKIYLTPSGTSGVYNMSYTEFDGSAYSWQDLGTTAIQLSDYATKAELNQLEAKVTNLNYDVNEIDLDTTDADVHQVNPSSTVETASGSRLRLIYPARKGSTMSASCSLGKGVAVNVYDTLENAVYAGVNYLQAITMATYAASVTADITVDGYLSISLSKTDGTSFSAQEKADFLAATNISVNRQSLQEQIDTVSEKIEEQTDKVKERVLNGFFVGKGTVYSSQAIKGLIGGHTYKLTFKSTVWGLPVGLNDGETIFGINSLYNDETTSLVVVTNREVVISSYDFDVPANSDGIYIGGRATVGTIVEWNIEDITETREIGFKYDSLQDALFVLRKNTSDGSTTDQSTGTRLRIVYYVPKGADVFVATNESSGVAIQLHNSLYHAIYGNNAVESYTSGTYKPSGHGITSVAGFLGISMTNGNTAITEDRKAEMLASLSIRITYGIKGDEPNTNSADFLNADMKDSLVSVGGVNAYASGNYDSPSAKKANLSILAITDIHGTFTSIRRAVDFANVNTDYIDYVACLGDVVLRSPADSIADFESAFANSIKPFLFTVGNHDTADTGLAAITEAQARTKYFTQVARKGWVSNFKDANSCSWYKDDATHKVRMISVFEYGNSQEIASGAPGTYCRRWIPTDTLQWFADTLYSTPSDYSVVVLLHQIPFFPATYVEGKFTISSGMRISLNLFFLNTVDGNPFGDIVDAFTNGTTLSKTYNSISSYGLGKTATVAKDFTGRGAGKFICFVVGHFHGSYIFKDATYPSQITIAVPSGSQSVFQQKYGDTYYAPGNRHEDQFYVIGFDTEKELINIAKIGGQVTNDMVKRDIISVKY